MAIYDDPAADNYHYYRGSDYDDAQLSVLERYRRYNGTEGKARFPLGSVASFVAFAQKGGSRLPPLWDSLLVLVNLKHQISILV